MSLDATWGGTAANSYISTSDADTLIAESILVTTHWDSATNKSAALIQASRDLDSLSLLGTKYYPTQTMEFPRSFPGMENFPWNNTAVGTLLQSPIQAECYRDVRLATCHQAIWLLQMANSTNHLQLQAQGVKMYTEETGPVKDFYSYGNSVISPIGNICADALKILRKWRTGLKIYRG